MTEWDAISDFLKEHGREEWGEKVARLTGKVYVLLDYDRSPLGVFSSREDAARDDTSLEVEEFIVDDLLEWEAGPVYSATIGVLDGEIDEIHTQTTVSNRHPSRCELSEHGTYRGGRHIIIASSPISTAHAMQAAMDRREEIRKAWTVPDRTDGDPWTTNANANPLEDIRRFRGLRERGDEHSALT